MLPRDTWRDIVAGWNTDLPPEKKVAAEYVEECLLSLERWRQGVRDGWEPESLDFWLALHQQFARRIPDELLLLLTDDEACCEDEGRCCDDGD